MKRQATQRAALRRTAVRTCAGCTVRTGTPCPILSPEQRMFTAYRHYRYQMETRPGVCNVLGQSVGEGHPLRQGFPGRSGGAHPLSHAEVFIGVMNAIVLTDPNTARRTQGIPVKEGEGTETVLGYCCKNSDCALQSGSHG